jgi:hypothetical protein
MLQEKYFTIIFRIIQNNLAVSVQSINDSKYIQVNIPYQIMSEWTNCSSKTINKSLLKVHS